MTIKIQEVRPEQVHIPYPSQEAEVLSSDELDTLIKEIEQLQPSTVVATPKSQEQINQEALQILSTAQDKAHEQILTGTNEIQSPKKAKSTKTVKKVKFFALVHY